MDAAHWIELIHQIPQDHHEVLLVGLANGMEITLQSVLRIEEHYLLVRGRISGTSEMGRAFCIPYQQLTYLHFTREVPDEKLTEVFGDLLSHEKKAPMMEGDEQRIVDGAVVADESVTSPEPAAPAAADMRERLRARLAAKTTNPKTAGR